MGRFTEDASLRLYRLFKGLSKVGFGQSRTVRSTVCTL